jgi:hypothetical protein
METDFDSAVADEVNQVLDQLLTSSAAMEVA